MPAMEVVEALPQTQPLAFYLVLPLVGAFSPVERPKTKADISFTLRTGHKLLKVVYLLLEVLCTTDVEPYGPTLFPN